MKKASPLRPLPGYQPRGPNANVPPEVERCECVAVIWKKKRDLSNYLIALKSPASPPRFVALQRSCWSVMDWEISLNCRCPSIHTSSFPLLHVTIFFSVMYEYHLSLGQIWVASFQIHWQCLEDVKVATESHWKMFLKKRLYIILYYSSN